MRYAKFHLSLGYIIWAKSPYIHYIWNILWIYHWIFPTKFTKYEILEWTNYPNKYKIL